MSKYLMAFDQGTTSSRAIIFDKSGNIKSLAQKEVSQIFPRPGWVEQDPVKIWSSQVSVAAECMAKMGVTASDIAAIGITNQRETTIVWEKSSGKPIYNAIVWQCRRTSEYCDSLALDGFDKVIKERTGLVADAYFSGTKIKWILDNVAGARDRAENGELLFGTIDSWLLWKMTLGRVYATDYSNASRTMLFNIHTLKWDEDICSRLDIPICMLPKVLPSSHVYGSCDASVLGGQIPIAGMAGDQQAAMFGQCCFDVGMVKNTYGTGCFILMQTGKTPVLSNSGLLTTIAWGAEGAVEYALEGSVFIAGAAIQWLRDGLGIIDNVEQSESYAVRVTDSNGVYFVPAFTGLGAPYWDQYARGAILGLTRGVTNHHIVRAALESVAYQSNDVIKAMIADSKECVKEIRVDGGASANDFLMQFQADIMGVELKRPAVTESTALGAAFLAGLAVGVYKNKDEIKDSVSTGRVFRPVMSADVRKNLIRGWEKAVKRSMGWAN